ncbi:MAG: site-specific integrase [Pyrinomonadaceae bacterium]|nr:site-specific integrase [Pyrinomonadaceae bacterium]
MGLYKRKGGATWYMDFIIDGERVNKSTGTSNKRKAEAFVEDFKSKIRNEGIGIIKREKAPTFVKAMADFLKWSEARQKKSTALRYTVASKALLAYFGEMRVDRITKPEIDKFINKRLTDYGAPRGVKPKTGKAKQKTREKISNATVNRELACLKKMFTNLVADKVLTTNEVKLVEFLEEENESGRVLSRDEERQYLMASSQPLKDYVTVLVETGLRPDELCRLAVQDVFVASDRPYLMVREGKTKSATRTVPLSERAANVLSRRILEAVGKYVFAGGRGGTEPNKPAVKFNNAHYGTLKRSKIDTDNRTGTTGTCTLYSFRHTFATRFLHDRPGDLLTLAALLGHSSLRMVMRYAHPSDEHKFDAIRSIEQKRSIAA